MGYNVGKFDGGDTVKNKFIMLSLLSLGILIGILASAASGAIAAVGDKIEATITKYIYVVNGEKKTVDVDPIVIQGTSYLPTRALANLLGYDVTYKAETSPDGVATIELSKTMDSLLIEMEYLLGQEEIASMEQVETADPAIEEKSIEEQIAEIDEQIAEIDEQIANYIKFRDLQRYVLDSEHVREIDKQKALEVQAGYDAKIAELERQKAELEAQLKEIEEAAQ